MTASWNEFTKELIELIPYSITIKNNWLWTENKKTEDPEHFFSSGVYSYLKELYETENDDLLENIKQIGDTALIYYPKNIEILSITSVANMLTENYDKAIQYLTRASDLNPKDFIVLNNLAHGYKLKGDKANAIKYYELAKKYGDAEAKQAAEEELKKLRKN